MPLKLAILISGRGSNMSAILEAIKNKTLDAEVSLVFSNNPDAQGLAIASSYGVKTASLSHKSLSREEHEKKVLEILMQHEIDLIVLAGYMRVLSNTFLQQFKGIPMSSPLLRGTTPATAPVAICNDSAQSATCHDAPLASAATCATSTHATHATAPVASSHGIAHSATCHDAPLASAATSATTAPSERSKTRRNAPPCSETEISFAPAELFRIINIHPSLLPSFPGAHGYEDAFAANVPASGITVHLVDELVDHGPILAQGSFDRQPTDDIDAFKSRGLALEHKLYPRVLQEISERGILDVLESFAQTTTISKMHDEQIKETPEEVQVK